MQIVHCPHCAAALSNDGSLAGQVATCAGCGGLFQMPALAPAPPADEPDLDVPRRRRQRAGGNAAFTTFVILALVIMPLLTLGVGIYLFASGQLGPKKQIKVIRPPPRKKGPREDRP